MLSALQGGGNSVNPISGAISGGLAKTLGSKFGLPPAAINAIVAALPGLLQRFAQKANDPNDKSITPESISGSLSGLTGGLGGLFGNK
jgi:hypothetical protein